jgi:hypothetical protein
MWESGLEIGPDADRPSLLFGSQSADWRDRSSHRPHRRSNLHLIAQAQNRPYRPAIMVMPMWMSVW